jgi:hypothetical protein
MSDSLKITTEEFSYRHLLELKSKRQPVRILVWGYHIDCLLCQYTSSSNYRFATLALFFFARALR